MISWFKKIRRSRYILVYKVTMWTQGIWPVAIYYHLTFRKRVTCLMRLPKKRLTAKSHQVISTHYRIAHKTCTVYPIKYTHCNTSLRSLVLCCLYSTIWGNPFNNLPQGFFTGFEVMISYCCPVPVTTMTSWNGNIFRVTGPLCREFTGGNIGGARHMLIAWYTALVHWRFMIGNNIMYLACQNRVKLRY